MGVHFMDLPVFERVLTSREVCIIDVSLDLYGGISYAETLNDVSLKRHCSLWSTPIIFLQTKNNATVFSQLELIWLDRSIVKLTLESIIKTWDTNTNWRFYPCLVFVNRLLLKFTQYGHSTLYSTNTVHQLTRTGRHKLCIHTQTSRKQEETHVQSRDALISTSDGHQTQHNSEG